MVKTLFLTSLLFFLWVGVQAQKNTEDFIYPKDKSPAITNCEIINIENGNLVSYFYHGNVYKVEAIAVKYKGQYIDLESRNTDSILLISSDTSQLLYNGHDFNYYYKKASRAQRISRSGSFFVFLGGMMGIPSAIMLKNNGVNNLRIALLGGGFVFFNVGVTQWISGGANKHAAINELEKIKPIKVSLKAGVNQDGIGLTLKF